MMPLSSPSSATWLSSIPIPLFSAVAGGVLVLVFFADYLRRRRAEVATIAAPVELAKSSEHKASKTHHTAGKKIHSKPHSHATDKDQGKRHHHLDLNTLKGHSDSVTALCFSPDGRNLATACGDGVVRVFKLDDATSKSFKLLRINLPAGANPTAITFSEGASSIVVAGQMLSGSSLYMYGNVEKQQQAKPSLPEIMWEHEKIHEKRSVLTLVGVSASHGSADGSTIVASCSEGVSGSPSILAHAEPYFSVSAGILNVGLGLTLLTWCIGPSLEFLCQSAPTTISPKGTDIKLWHGKSGKYLGTVDTNQLKNTMATISPNGRFLAAAAFTADVKVWEIIYSKDGSVKEVLKAMQLKGHKSAVTWLCFSPNSEQIITSSKDGTLRVWNINVRYHLDEDPKTLKVFPIPLHDAKGSALHYDQMALSPDGKILAATYASTLQWLCAETGKVLDTADKSHEGDITGIAWASQKISVGSELAMVLATAGADKKVKLWMAPDNPSILKGL